MHTTVREPVQRPELTELAELGEPESGLVIIEGPPGSGKTTLLDELTQWLGRGRTVLSAGCGRLDSGYESGLIGQLFEALFSDPELAGARESLDLVRNALAEASAGRRDVIRLQDAVLRLTGELVRREPVLICVDDVQWGDGPSLACLAHLARRTARQPVLIALTRCPQVLATPPDGLAELLLRPDCVRVQPTPLDQHQVAALIGSALTASPRPELVAFCHRITRGNPQMLIELIRAMSETDIAPDGVTEARFTGLVAEITTRRALELLRRQPDDVQDLVEVLAVLGDRGLDVATDLTQLESAQIKRSIHELVKLGLLRQSTAGRPALANEPLHDAVRNGLSPDTRDELRIRAARALSVRGAPVEDVAAAVLGTQPGRDSWVVEVLCEAARARMATGHSEEVVGYLQRVLREQLEPRKRAELLLQLGNARLHGDPETAGRHFGEVARLTADPRMRAAALIGFCQAGLLVQRPLEVTPQLCEAIRELMTVDDMTEADREALLRLRAMLVISSPDRLPSAGGSSDEPGRSDARQTTQAASDARQTTPAECELLSAFALQISERAGSASEAVGLALRAMSGTSLRERESHSLFVRSVNVLLYADQLDAAMQWAGRMAEAGSRQSWRLYQLIGRCLRAEAAYRKGDLELSLGEARAAFEFTGISDRCAYHALAVASLTRVLTELNRLDEAEGFLDEHGIVLSGAPRTRITILAARSRLLARQGDLDGALYDILEAGRLLGTLGIVNPAIVPWRSQAAELHAKLGNLTRARELAEEELSLARAWGTPRATGIALRARGKVAEGAASVSLLEEAVRVLSDSSARLELASAYAELGARHRILGATVSARRDLRSAAVLAEHCAGHALLADVRAELLLSGARPRTAAQSGPAALTPSERRVAQLAAQGHRNRQIAERLSVSPNTVEVHLTNTYRKLAISSRAQLAGVLCLTADHKAEKQHAPAGFPEPLPGRMRPGVDPRRERPSLR
jgi:DNA-binding NarL/FixJ family response regulator